MVRGTLYVCMRMRCGRNKGFGTGDITNIINFAGITDITLHWVRPEPELFFFFFA